MIELLAPAGDMNKLKAAFYYGADAVYIGGKSMSLRALAGNFSDEEIVEAVEYAHKQNKKVYVTVNIFIRNSDLEYAEKYLKFLEKTEIDGVIISDTGLISLCKRVSPNLKINVSTQANILNVETVKFWQEFGVKRVILARELSLKEIETIHLACPEMELETFVHGAMCISYSGRCLLSNYLTGRDSNRGECVQACRWEYEIREINSNGEYLTIDEDEKGSYILNSKDLNLIDFIGELNESGVMSFKIEGRMKSEYYLATVIGAYRRAIDAYYKVGKAYREDKTYKEELLKPAHREYTTAYLLGENEKTVNYDNSQSKGSAIFIANVLGYDKKEGYALVEMRNRFKVGDILEVLSPGENHNKKIKIEKLLNEKDEIVSDAKLVQQKLKLYTNVVLSVGDMLDKKI